MRLKLLKTVTRPTGSLVTREIVVEDRTVIGQMFSGQGAARRVVIYEKTGWTREYELVEEVNDANNRN